ncbi:hypothetical protein GCM10010464_18790 [Pseudonocardia yunnanensis]
MSRMQASRIFLVGTGVVGLATGRGFLEAGHEVSFVDMVATNDRLAAVVGREVDDAREPVPGVSGAGRS